MLLLGCSEEEPVPSSSQTPRDIPSPKVIASPSSSPTPIQKLAPDYPQRLKKAEGLALGGDYERALPILESLLEETDEDSEVHYLSLLCHGWQEELPRRDSKAAEHAKLLLALEADPKHSAKARAYLAAADLAGLEEPKYGDKTRRAQVEYQFFPKERYRVLASGALHVRVGKGRIKPLDQGELFGAVASPSRFSHLHTLEEGQMAKVLRQETFLYSLNSWRKALRPGLQDYDKSIFEVTAFYLEVSSEGPLKGQKGWFVHHIDRWVDRPGNDPWGEWISNRVDLDNPVDESGLAIDIPEPTILDIDGGKDLHRWRDPKSKLYGFKKSHDGTGPWVIKPQFGDAADGFSEGVACVREATEEAPVWGFIDPKGEWILKPQFEGQSRFSGGYAMVTKTGKKRRRVSQMKETYKSGNVAWTGPNAKTKTVVTWERETGARGWVNLSGKFITEMPKAWEQGR